jgi:hypothetical protein
MSLFGTGISAPSQDAFNCVYLTRAFRSLPSPVELARLAHFDGEILTPRRPDFAQASGPVVTRSSDRSRPEGHAGGIVLEVAGKALGGEAG